jgi:hypothetical protein
MLPSADADEHDCGDDHVTVLAMGIGNYVDADADADNSDGDVGSMLMMMSCGTLSNAIYFVQPCKQSPTTISTLHCSASY